MRETGLWCQQICGGDSPFGAVELKSRNRNQNVALDTTDHFSFSDDKTHEDADLHSRFEVVR